MAADAANAARDAACFDQWYANMAHSPVRDQIVQQTLGLPSGLHSTSVLSWAGVADVTASLALAPGLLVDLAGPLTRRAGVSGPAVSVGAWTGKSSSSPSR